MAEPGTGRRFWRTPAPSARRASRWMSRYNGPANGLLEACDWPAGRHRYWARCLAMLCVPASSG